MIRKWLLRITVVLLVVFVGVAFALDIPRLAWGILTYGQQRQEGMLLVGDQAPSTLVHNMATGAAEELGDWIGDKPTVLIFGSCT